MGTVIAGLRWSKTCGDHPGTVPLVMLVTLGLTAGGILGAFVMLAVFGPLYLYGAWERGKIAQQQKEAP